MGHHSKVCCCWLGGWEILIGSSRRRLARHLAAVSCRDARHRNQHRLVQATAGGSVAECWTQAQKGQLQIAAATLSGNSLRQTVQIVCIWSSCCHCHPKTPSSLASFKSRLVLPFWYWLTQVVLEKIPLNGRSNSNSSSSMLCAVLSGHH